jgi:hypothetical protein
MKELRWNVLVLATLLCCTRLSGDQSQPQPPKTLPLPRYYKKLELDKKQIEKVQKVEAEFQVRIDRLTRQLQSLRKEQSVELEKCLTDAQRSRLKELQDQGPGLFKISAPRLPVKVHVGKTCDFGVELSYDKGFEGDVRLTYPDLPEGMTILPNPFVFKEGESRIATLTISTKQTLPQRDYRITIQATPDNGDPTEVTVQLVVTR